MSFSYLFTTFDLTVKSFDKKLMLELFHDVQLRCLKFIVHLFNVHMFYGCGLGVGFLPFLHLVYRAVDISANDTPRNGLCIMHVLVCGWSQVFRLILVVCNIFTVPINYKILRLHIYWIKL